jgi:hypothetical protein
VAQYGTATAQHSTAQRGLAEVVRAGYSRHLFVEFFFAYAGLVRELGNVAGFVSEGCLNTRSPLGWCRGSLGGGLCCICVWWAVWRDA